MDDPCIGLKMPKTHGDVKRSATIPAGEWGQMAEELGYDSIWASEAWGSDAFVDLSEIACRTSRIGLGTAIVNVYSRSPAALTMAATSLQETSRGRMILGLGASHRGTIEGLHGLSYSRPFRRTGETLDLIRAYTGADGPVTFDGEIFDVDGAAPLDIPVPVYNAALGADNRRLTGQLADGWIPFLIPFSQLSVAFEAVSAGAEAAGREPGEITVTPQVLTVVHSDPGAAERFIEEYVASYIGRFRNYRNVIEKTYPDESADIAAAWERGDEERAVDLVTDEMRRDFGVAGTPSDCRTRLVELVDHPTIDRPIVYVPFNADHDTTVRTIETLSPAELP